MCIRDRVWGVIDWVSVVTDRDRILVIIKLEGGDRVIPLHPRHHQIPSTNGYKQHRAYHSNLNSSATVPLIPIRIHSQSLHFMFKCGVISTISFNDRKQFHSIWQRLFRKWRTFTHIACAGVCHMTLNYSLLSFSSLYVMLCNQTYVFNPSPHVSSRWLNWKSLQVWHSKCDSVLNATKISPL